MKKSGRRSTAPAGPEERKDNEGEKSDGSKDLRLREDGGARAVQGRPVCPLTESERENGQSPLSQERSKRGQNETMCVESRLGMGNPPEEPTDRVVCLCDRVLEIRPAGKKRKVLGLSREVTRRR
jgi:hypothetical protein